MKSKIVYYSVYILFRLLSLLPLKCLYALATFLYYLLYYVIRYRRKVVRRNLTRSFPEKSLSEVLAIEKKFYRYLCDYFFEDIKLMNISSEELQQRMSYFNKEQYLSMIEKYGGIILLIPHYANYEWIVGMGAIMNSSDVPVQVYKPLKNIHMDNLFKHIRSRFGGYNVPKHSTARELIKLRRAGKKMAVGLITDQWPARDERYWTTFLNQETAFLTGADRIARLMKFPVFYCELEKPKRGYCKVTFDLLTETPHKMAKNEITQLFAQRLEQTIKNEPAYWLWSHKRWKKSQVEWESYLKNDKS